MEPTPGVEAAFTGDAETPTGRANGLVRCPICGSNHTRLYRSDLSDLEYFVVPLRPFALQKCTDCGSEFLNPRPLEAEPPPFYPDDYHAYNENHGGVARLLVEFRARS